MGGASKQLQEAINALIVKKCGTKVYWDVWAKDIAGIALRHIQRISEIICTDETAQVEFGKFLQGLRDSLNNSITEAQAVEMLAQHIITLPVFEALFAGADFAKSNPVSIAMEKMLAVLRRNTLETEAEKRELRELYASVRMRAEGIRTDAGRQAVIKDLYESFFKEAFKATSEKMGIVYTPSQVVDYILHATDRLLFKEFRQHLCDEGVHILDAFTGTGTFIVDLINDTELMPTDKLPYKYRHEIHCNEIMLLAYYIASINIEHAYHSRVGGEYESFPGAVLTDTFQMYEDNDLIDVEMFVDNSERVLRQMETPIHVLVGNPPWSSGQNSANENNANESYPTLDRRIATTYAARTQATNKNSLYDSYIRAFRWASDRIGEKGIVAFVTNGGWLRSDSANGFRRCLSEEFSSIYVFDLRGNQRTQGEQSRKEGGKIFGAGSRAPVAITMLVKNPSSSERGVIRYHDIGDYLSREDKLSIVGASVLSEPFTWEILRPDHHGDWLEQRDDSWYRFAPMGVEKLKEPLGMFEIWSNGLKTERDVWAWNYSSAALEQNIRKTIQFYEKERKRRAASLDSIEINDFVEYDETSIKWNWGLLSNCSRNQEISFSAKRITEGAFRPFCKQWVYYSSELNGRVYQIPKLFPLGYKNVVIALSGAKGLSALISNTIVDLHYVGDAQCFPLYWYESAGSGRVIRHDAITDDALSVFRKVYPGGVAENAKKNRYREIQKEDIFYYVYGILHSEEYRSRFAANLKKELPRIPFAEDFDAFCQAGKKLAGIHLNYESAEMYPLTIVGNVEDPGPVQKLRWGKKKDPEAGRSVEDRSVLVYSSRLTYKGIPEAAHRYVVNGRSPLEWMIDRYQVKTDPASGIVNDPNAYSDDPCYISNLIRRLVTVSVETMRIVDALPPINEQDRYADFPYAWKVHESSPVMSEE